MLRCQFIRLVAVVSGFGTVASPCIDTPPWFLLYLFMFLIMFLSLRLQQRCIISHRILSRLIFVRICSRQFVRFIVVPLVNDTDI